MREIIGISCLLLGASLWACRVDSSSEPHSQPGGPDSVVRSVQSNPAAVRWVRTVDGWERPSSWSLEPSRQISLHPLVVATGQVLLSLLALIYFDGEAGRSRPPARRAR